MLKQGTAANMKQGPAESYVMRNVKFVVITKHSGPGSVVGDWLRAGRSGDRIPVRARFSAHLQTGPGAHPASCTMGTGSFPG